MENKFYIGQKVICINDCYWKGDDGFYCTGPENGEINTIDFIETKPDRQTIGLGFCKYNSVEGYNSDEFRPISEKSLESECFADALIKKVEEDMDMATEIIIHITEMMGLKAKLKNWKKRTKN